MQTLSIFDLKRRKYASVLLGASLIYLYINYIMSRLGNYLRDTATEMKHVSWPTQTQAMAYTALVILVSGVVALLLGGFDYVFTSILDMVVGI